VRNFKSSRISIWTFFENLLFWVVQKCLSVPRLATYLFVNDDSLLAYKLSAMYAVSVTTRDALTELCYVSVPWQVGSGGFQMTRQMARWT
jgi:hypothetical protein